MKILFIIESISKHKKDIYSDDLLMAEHLKRKHEVLVAEPKDVILLHNEVFVRCHSYQKIKKSVKFKEKGIIIAKTLDFIYYRAMPPVEKDVLLATLILDKLPVKFCNAPEAIRNLNEKLSIFNFKEFLLPTLVTGNSQDILNFAKQYKWPLILKPLDSYQGIGIYKMENKEQLSAINQLTIVQPYLKSVETEGSKRIFVLKGKVAGAVTFLPKPGEFITNYQGIYNQTQVALSKKEQKACEYIGVFLLHQKVNFAALDFIGNYLMEINITCPGGIPEYNKAYGTRLEEKIVDELLA
ncbi:MAG: hypothetical protein PHV30_01475 [Candidatus Margulisbacteria bacterium]|nr:hypothetical protein [Candidatus Margulisiibacteriota bacterium]